MSTDTSVYPGAFDSEKFLLPAFNNVKTTLSTYVAPNQTSIINVNSTLGFPNEGIISIDKEIIYYRSIVGNSFRNITRGYDGTTAFQHSSGADVELRWVAAHHNRLKSSIKAIERTLGINPQGLYPDIASRLSAYFNGVNKRTSKTFLKHDGITTTETGYTESGRKARMFISSERFIKVPGYGPTVYIDGIAQIQNDPLFLVNNLALTSVDVNDGTNKGIVSCSTGTFLSNGISTGDLLVIKGTPTNNDAYIVDSVLSNTQIKVSQIIFGVDQLVGAVGSISIIDVANPLYPVKDIVSIPLNFTSSDEADAVIFLNPPETLQEIRFDYEIKNSGAIVTYSNPIAVLADYQAPSHSGSVLANGIDLFTLDIARTRALVFKLHLTGTLTPSTSVKIEIFGKNDLTQLQYSNTVNLTTPLIDSLVWHFDNKDDIPVNNMYVKITDLAAQAFNYTLTIEVEALGNNA